MQSNENISELEKSLVNFSFKQYEEEQYINAKCKNALDKFNVLFDMEQIYNEVFINSFRKLYGYKEKPITALHTELVDMIKKGIALIFEDFEHNLIVGKDLMWRKDIEKYKIYDIYIKSLNGEEQEINFSKYYNELKNLNNIKVDKLPVAQALDTESLYNFSEDREKYDSVNIIVPENKRIVKETKIDEHIIGLIKPIIQEKISSFIKEENDFIINDSDSDYLVNLPQIILYTFHLTNQQKDKVDIIKDVLKHFPNKVSFYFINDLIKIQKCLCQKLSNITSKGSLSSSSKFKTILSK